MKAARWHLAIGAHLAVGKIASTARAMSKPSPILAAMFVLAFGTLLALSASATVIAHWRFEPDDFMGDASGNGHTLTSANPPASVTDVANVDGGSGSALFNGNGNILSTLDTLDLTGVSGSSEPILRISFALRANDTAVAVVAEHGTPYLGIVGGFIVTAAESDPNTGTAGWNMASATLNVDQLPHANDNTWEQYQIEFNSAATSAASVVQIWRNGTLLADTPLLPYTNLVNPAAFANDIFNIGARGGGQFTLAGNIDELKIESVAGVPGDYNQNRQVDTADYVVWRDTLGQTGAGLAADGDGNEVVDDLDYDFWRERFGNTSGAGTGAELTVAVPEPVGLTLTAIAMSALAAIDRRRRKLA